MTINREIGLLHPKARGHFVALNQALTRGYEVGDTQTLFKLFEGYRSPDRQHYLLTETSSTKARPWQSAHQYGLAAEFVPYTDDGWSWDDRHDWSFLHDCAALVGLKTPIG